MYNKKALSKAVSELSKAKAPAKKKDKIYTNKETLSPFVSSEGFKQGPPPPGTNYRIPGDTLYNPTPYPIEAVSDNGIRKTLEPYDTTNTYFPGATHVDEYEMGGADYYDDELTEDEINELRRGGYIVEEIEQNPYKNGGALLTKKVTCKNCGWEWDAADGGNDLTTCHKCGGQGLVHAKKGGEKKYSKSLEAKNRLFVVNKLTKKKKSKKNKIFDPNAKYYQDGGENQVQCDDDGRCYETDQAQELLDKTHRTVTTGLDIDRHVAEQVWNGTPANQAWQALGLKTADQLTGNKNAFSCSTYSNLGNKACDDSIQYEDILSNARMKNAVNAGRTPYRKVATYPNKQFLNQDVLKPGQLVSFMGNGINHMVKYYGPWNEDEKAFMQSNGDPKDWSVFTNHGWLPNVPATVYEYAPHYDEIQALEEKARTNPTYVPGTASVGSLPLRPVGNLATTESERVLPPNAEDLGIRQFGGIPTLPLNRGRKVLRDWVYGADIGMLQEADGGESSIFQSGGQIYKYADRPEASYMKDKNGKWLIMLPSTHGQYVPLNDPTGKRAGELDEKAVLDPRQFRKQYEPLDQKPLPSETTQAVAQDYMGAQNSREYADRVDLARYRANVADPSNLYGKMTNAQLQTEIDKLSPEERQQVSDMGNEYHDPVRGVGEGTYRNPASFTEAIDWRFLSNQNDWNKWADQQWDQNKRKVYANDTEAGKAFLEEKMRQKYASLNTPYRPPSAENNYNDGAIQSADWFWTLPILATSAGTSAITESLPSMVSNIGKTNVLNNAVTRGVLGSDLLGAGNVASRFGTVDKLLKLATYGKTAGYIPEVASNAYSIGKDLVSLQGDMNDQQKQEAQNRIQENIGNLGKVAYDTFLDYGPSSKVASLLKLNKYVPKATEGDDAVSSYKSFKNLGALLKRKSGGDNNQDYIELDLTDAEIKRLRDLGHYVEEY